MKFLILQETYEIIEVFYRNNGVILIENCNIRGCSFYTSSLQLLNPERKPYPTIF